MASEMSQTQARRQELAAGGGTFLKYCIGYMQQSGGQTWNGGHRFQMRGAGTTGPPAGDGPGQTSVNFNKNRKCKPFQKMETTLAGCISKYSLPFLTDIR